MVNTLTDSPIASHTLAADQPLMESNNKYYAHTLIVDHQIGDATPNLSMGNNDGIAGEGFHKVIHFVKQVADPVLVANTGELYTKTVAADVQLFYQSPGGIVSQLTTALAPQRANPGISYLPGGVILIWDSTTLDNLGNTIRNGSAFTFPFGGFTTQCFTIFLSAEKASTGAEGLWVRAGTNTPSGFTINTSASSGQLSPLYYLAIGF